MKKIREEKGKENKILHHEIRLLEGENGRLAAENEDLRKKVVKMDKIVYGRAKSPHVKY